MKEDISIDDPSPHELYQEGLKAYREKDYQNALLYFNQALEQDPRYESALNAKGVVLHSLGRYSEAVTSFDLALSVNPMNEKARQNREKANNKISNYISPTQNPNPNVPIKTKPSPPPVQRDHYEDDYKKNYLLYIWLFCILPFAIGGSIGVLIYAIISAIFVYIDSKEINAGNETGYGVFIDIPPWEWALFTCFLWLFGYPLYLYYRHAIFEVNNDEIEGGVSSTRTRNWNKNCRIYFNFNFNYYGWNNR